MTVTLLVDTYGGGRATIYTGDPADESPHTAPLSHLGLIKFSSALAYPKIIGQQTVNVTFPARTTLSGGSYYAAQPRFTESQNLFAHGRPGKPWVLASVEIGGQQVPFTGSVPVQQATQQGTGNPEAWVRWVSVGADGTNVMVFEYTTVTRNATTGYSGILLPQITLPITVWTTDKILS